VTATLTRPLALAALLSLGGCIDLLGAGPAPQCEVTADCNEAAGEVCAEGVCWGNPPPGHYAVAIGPPPGRPDLARNEIVELAIRNDGWMSELRVQPSVLLRGRIEASCELCRDGTSIAATIHVRRASLIPGGRELLLTSQSVADALTGDSFAIPVPPLEPGDPPYELTIEPSATAPLVPGGPTPAQLVPPLRALVDAEQLAAGVQVMLRPDDQRTISGRVLAATGVGIPNLRVVARGRVDPLRPLEVVSTIGTTDGQGRFALLLGAEALDVVDLEARPPAGVIAPTLTAHDRYIAGVEPIELRMPAIPATTRITLPIEVVDTGGTRSPVPQARVWLRTRLDTVDPAVAAVFTVSGETDATGRFTADVIAGAAGDAREYEARIAPPADAIAASRLEVIAIGAAGGELPALRLAQRSTLTGVIADHAGAPVGAVTVAAQPSLFFLWSLDGAAQQRLQDREQPSVVSNPDGTFTLWVDPAAAGQAAHYDLECEPAEMARVPRWTIPEVEASASRDLGVLRLPAAAHVRARVGDPGGAPLADAAVRIYEIVAEGAVCGADHAPKDCLPPAILRATARSDEDGVVRLVLPRP
jgi:hypothetical protein